MNNQVLAILLVTPTVIFFLLGFFEGALGYPAGETILPLIVEDVISLIGIVFIAWAAYRLFHTPNQE